VTPDEGHVLAFRHQCVFCAEPIAPAEPDVSILIAVPGLSVHHYQVNAHLDCAKKAAHPDTAKVFDLDELARREQTSIARMNQAFEAMPWWRWRSRRHLRALGAVPADRDD
jgi:hypothetical protein